jgi:hypothetical protein
LVCATLGIAYSVTTTLAATATETVVVVTVAEGTAVASIGCF